MVIYKDQNALPSFGPLKGAILAFDLDDTLLQEDLTILPRVKEGLRKCRERGAIVTFATGRMFESALKYAKELNLDVPIVTYNGAVVKAMTGEVLRESRLSEEVITKLINFSRKEGLYLQMYNQGKLYIEKMCDGAGLDPDLVNGYVEVGDFLSAPMPNTPKAMLVTDPAENARLIEKLKNEVSGLYIAASKPYLIEIMEQGITKAESLKLFGVDPSRIITFGDSTNDIEMIKWSGASVAVANARAELLEVADYVAKGERGEGVAEVLEYLLSKEE